MRLVTWNCCRGPFVKNAALLDPLGADVAVLLECGRPAIETDQCLWFGDNVRQGIAVVAKGAYRLRVLADLAEAPRYVIPIEVLGPVHFVLIAVWAQKNAVHPYVEGVIHAVELYRSLFAVYRVVLLGDLNSNAIWDSSHRLGLSHSALVQTLSSLGLVSSYHDFHGEAHGEEKQPTFYFQWKQERPFHLDYCFVPKQWMPGLRRVEVGTFAEWAGHSDHRPILVEFDDENRKKYLRTF